MSDLVTLEALQTVIDHLDPEWATILGPDAPAFQAELAALLPQATVTTLLEFFGRYPAAHEHLLDALEHGQPDAESPTRGGLFGTPGTLPSAYQCAIGPHQVASYEVTRDTLGQAHCPVHQTVLIRKQR